MNMEHIGYFILFTVLIALIKYFCNEHSKTDSSNNKIADAEIVEAPAYSSIPTTRSLLFSVMQNLNLDYEVVEDGVILFKYQGENMQILASDDKKYILIRDLWWYSAPLDDIENLSILHRAVNECNLQNAINVIAYTQVRDENIIGLHTFRVLLWIPELPEIDHYFQGALDSMLYIHQRFYDKMESIRREQHIEANQ